MQIIKRTGKKEEVDNKRKGGNCYKFKKGGRKVDKIKKIKTKKTVEEGQQKTKNWARASANRGEKDFVFPIQ